MQKVDILHWDLHFHNGKGYPVIECPDCGAKRLLGWEKYKVEYDGNVVPMFKCENVGCGFKAWLTLVRRKPFRQRDYSYAR